MALAVQNYYDVWKVFPDGGGQLPGGGSTWSWEVTILPYVEENNVSQSIDYRQPYYATRRIWPRSNVRAALSMPSAPANQLVTCCTLDSRRGDTAETNYLAVATHRQVTEAVDYNGTGIMFPLSHPKIRDVADGTSKSLFVCEADFCRAIRFLSCIRLIVRGVLLHGLSVVWLCGGHDLLRYQLATHSTRPAFRAGIPAEPISLLPTAMCRFSPRTLRRIRWRAHHAQRRRNDQ